jgi:hypothetical protein
MAAKQRPAATPTRQLAGFLARYSPEVRAVAADALATMRKRLPGAVEMVYDNCNALVIGFGQTDRASDAVFSIALYPRYVTLFFLSGADLEDPDGLLKGSGSRVRSIRLEDASTLDRPEVTRLMMRAVQAEGQRFDGKTPRRLIIRSVSPKRRSRRPSAAKSR